MILPLEEHLFPDVLAALAESPVALRNLLNRKRWLLIINCWNILESLQRVLSFWIMTWRLFFLLIHFIKSSNCFNHYYYCYYYYYYYYYYYSHDYYRRIIIIVVLKSAYTDFHNGLFLGDKCIFIMSRSRTLHARPNRATFKRNFN